ncbi:uncharacterized protein LOC115537255 [Gadus morhua]|uniref:Uncharacterized LOC115537255 n=1 Tax=Gadus morhua TaxID=8049 RepID=A0A8C5FSA8_GADMO|nr:uncharacterized protein LOC115537255 [Gadus morhua]
MTTCGTVTKSLLMLAVVVALTGQGSAVEKFSECCTRVSRQEITETIVDYMVQQRNNNHCVNAIIFQTESGSFYCSKFDEPWVMRKVRQLRRTKRAALASTPSLLKLITSTATPPSTAPPTHSSSPPSPSSPTSLLKLITSSSAPPPLERTTGTTPSTHYTVQ